MVLFSHIVSTVWLCIKGTYGKFIGRNVNENRVKIK